MSGNPNPPLTIGQMATLACLLEVSIPKPGNVHRSADFEDTTLQDFLVSAVAIGPAMQTASQTPLGDTVLDAIHATRRQVRVNTNLGIVLLLAPLATVICPDSAAIRRCLAQSGAADCRKFFQAISACQPGGLGKSSRHDVAGDEVPENIVVAMREAARRDSIARQYTCGFRDIFEFVLPCLESGLAEGYSLTDAVIRAHLKIMHEFPDSLIARKNGPELARQSAARAGHVISSGQPGEAGYLKALGDFDFWLRADGNRRNPGTTADLIAAGLFTGLRRGTIDLGENRS